MEGDMKEIVLQRLEQRLKEKDAEIHALKKELEATQGSSNYDLKGLNDRIDALEMKVVETQVTLSEVMKKVGALELALNTALTVIGAGGKGAPEEDLSMAGDLPMGSQPFEQFGALDQKDIKEDGHRDDDATRFFHLSKDS